MTEAVQLSSNVSAGPFIATDLINSTHHPLTKLEYGSSGSATLVSSVNPLPVISTTPTVLSTAGMGGSSNSLLHVIIDSTVTILGTTASVFQVEPKAGASFAVTFSTASTASVIIANSTSQKIPVIIEGSTGTIPISGNSTAIISTASAIQVEPKAGASFAVTFSTASTGSVTIAGGQSSVSISGGKSTVTVEAAGVFPTAFASVDFDSSAVSTNNALAVGLVVPSTSGPLLIGNSSGIPVTLSTNSTVGVWVNGGQSSVSISGGQSTAIISTASIIQVEPKAGASFAVTFSTASTGSVIVANTTASLVPIKLENAFGSTTALAISGNSTAIISTTSKIVADISTASSIRIGNDTAQLVPIKIENAFGSTTTLAISGNSTAIISTASKIEVLQATSTNLNGVMRQWAGPTESTWSVNKITSTAVTTIYSSAASTRFNLVDVTAINSGASETVLSIYSASTAGTLLFQAPLSTAAGGFSITLGIARACTAAGVPMVAEIVPASTVYLNTGAFKSA